ncbi:MAG: hypothetical protein OXT09_08650 [Myxococcales bacterium]|nr:hypothetical protein [Myxococcales bacterium]
MSVEDVELGQGAAPGKTSVVRAGGRAEDASCVLISGLFASTFPMP